MKSTSASCPGRVCLAGEDIDWIAGPSILCAIELRTVVTVRPTLSGATHFVLRSGEPFFTKRLVQLDDVGRYGGHVMDYVQAALKLALDIGAPTSPLEIEVASTIPPSSGLASSAAVVLATLGALNAYFGLKKSDLELFELAYLVENRELMTGAGRMDFYACGLGQAIYLDCSQVAPLRPQRLNFPTGCHLVIADTLTPRSTSTIIRGKRERLKLGDPLMLKYVEDSLKLIASMQSALSMNNPRPDNIGSMISLSHEYLRQYLMVSTPLLDTCVQDCVEAGAYGAKLTGTGMGGCMFALVPDNKLFDVVAALASHPVRVYQPDITARGLITS